jgi:hypothetical protein
LTQNVNVVLSATEDPTVAWMNNDQMPPMKKYSGAMVYVPSLLFTAFAGSAPWVWSGIHGSAGWPLSGNVRTASFTGCPVASRTFTVHVLLSTAGGLSFAPTMTNESMPESPLCVRPSMKSSARGSDVQPILPSDVAPTSELFEPDVSLFDEQPPRPPSAAPAIASSDSLMKPGTSRDCDCSAMTKPFLSEDR